MEAAGGILWVNASLSIPPMRLLQTPCPATVHALVAELQEVGGDRGGGMVVSCHLQEAWRSGRCGSLAGFHWWHCLPPPQQSPP
jgi:hypothetical protein